MAIAISLCAFSKPFNSTARPSTFGTTVSGELKDKSGIRNPRILWNYGTASPSGWNYAYIPVFGRYYYITEWVYQGGGIWEIQMQVDVMATYRDEIGASTQYVLRSSVNFDQTIVDDMYPQKAVVTRQSNSVTPFAGFNTGTYSIILGVIGKRVGENRTGINYYVMSSAVFSAFLNSIFGDNDYYGVSEISFQLVKALANPADYITTCRLLPFSAPTGGNETIKIGWWDSGVTGSILGTNPTFVWTGSLTIPKHPQAANRGAYLNISAARYTLFSPLWGNIPINPASLLNSTTLSISVRVDCISGVGELMISADGTVIEKTTTQVSTEIPIGQVSQDFASAASSALSGAGAAMAGNAIGIAASIGDVAMHLIPQARISGTVGYTGAYSQPFILVGEFNSIVDGADANEGRPCCKLLGIAATGAGYYQCRDAKVNTAGMASENEEIKATMEAGFYYA